MHEKRILSKPSTAAENSATQSWIFLCKLYSGLDVWVIFSINWFWWDVLVIVAVSELPHSQVRSCLFWQVFSLPAFVCNLFSLCLAVGEEGGEGGGRVMGGGLLPSICCDGRLGSPEGASAWPDRNHHWSVWHQASPQLWVLIRLLVDPQSSQTAADTPTILLFSAAMPRFNVVLPSVNSKKLHRVCKSDNTMAMCPDTWK